MILAPPSFASSGVISGTGLARGKTIGSFAIEEIISLVTNLGAETPTNRSAPTKASFNNPFNCLLFEM